MRAAVQQPAVLPHPRSSDLSSSLTSSSSPPHPDHPFISVQADWELSITELSSAHPSTSTSSSSPPPSFWLSSTSSAHDTTEGHCTAALPSTASPSPLPSLTPSDGFTASLSSPLLLSVACPSTSASYPLLAPSSTLSSALLSHRPGQPITSVALSPLDPAVLLSGSTDGSLTLASLPAPLTRLTPPTASPLASPPTPFTGHAGDVSLCLFFPSGHVVLTASLDLTFRVFALTSPTVPAATLSGHQQRITAVQLIDRGRHFVSASLDGSVRLWDCSRGKAIAEYGVTPATARTTAMGVNDVCVLRPVMHPMALSKGGDGGGGGETEAYEGSLVLAACEDGHVRGYDMRAPSSSSPAVDVATGVGVNALTQFVPHSVTMAMANGFMAAVDLRTLQPRLTWRRERDVAVVKVEAEGAEWLWSADELGVVTRWSVARDAATIDRELTGIDMEPMRGWAFQRDTTGRVERIVTAADAVRIYSL